MFQHGIVCGYHLSSWFASTQVTMPCGSKIHKANLYFGIGSMEKSCEALRHEHQNPPKLLDLKYYQKLFKSWLIPQGNSWTWENMKNYIFLGSLTWNNIKCS